MNRNPTVREGARPEISHNNGSLLRNQSLATLPNDRVSAIDATLPRISTLELQVSHNSFLIESCRISRNNQ